MGIDTPHPAYAANQGIWARCRDAYSGEDAVKAAGQTYLPKLGGQDGAEYGAYKTRAMYFEAVGRTVDGFTGAISRKDPVLTLPGAAADLFGNDVTGDGVGLKEFIKKLCSETLLTARCGVFVDYDDAQQRPVLSIYPAESITNWGDFGIVLREEVFVANPDDPFALSAITQYRQLTIEGGVYVVYFWRKPPGMAVGEQFVIHERVVPTLRGIPRDQIPFFWLSTMGMTSRIEKPPLLGLVNTSMSHYRSSADLEHGRHFTGLPTLYLIGDDGKDDLYVGSSAVMRIGNENAKVGYAEFSGQGLKSLENALVEKAHIMAVLGASLIAAPKAGVEAADTARIRTSGENSLLMGVVSGVEETLEAALECAAAWLGSPGPVDIEINREFAEMTMDPQMLVGLVAAYQAGALSLPQFLFNMQQSDLLAPDTDLDAEAELLVKQAEQKAAEQQALAATKTKVPGKVSGA